MPGAVAEVEADHLTSVTVTSGTVTHIVIICSQMVILAMARMVLLVALVQRELQVVRLVKDLVLAQVAQEDQVVLIPVVRGVEVTRVPLDLPLVLQETLL
jgi:hypothetical protein